MFQSEYWGVKVTDQASEIVLDACNGDQKAAEKLLPVVYQQLKDIADRFMRRERQNHSLQATALVHEAYVKLVDQNRVDWRGRTHFCAVAANAMRRILLDHARKQPIIRNCTDGGW